MAMASTVSRATGSQRAPPTLLAVTAVHDSDATAADEPSAPIKEAQKGEPIKNDGLGVSSAKVPPVLVTHAKGVSINAPIALVHDGDTLLKRIEQLTDIVAGSSGKEGQLLSWRARVTGGNESDTSSVVTSVPGTESAAGRDRTITDKASGKGDVVKVEGGWVTLFDWLQEMEPEGVRVRLGAPSTLPVPLGVSVGVIVRRCVPEWLCDRLEGEVSEGFCVLLRVVEMLDVPTLLRLEVPVSEGDSDWDVDGEGVLLGEFEEERVGESLGTSTHLITWLL
jgi:hypothetical protein